MLSMQSMQSMQSLLWTGEWTHSTTHLCTHWMAFHTSMLEQINVRQWVAVPLVGPVFLMLGLKSRYLPLGSTIVESSRWHQQWITWSTNPKETRNTFWPMINFQPNPPHFVLANWRLGTSAGLTVGAFDPWCCFATFVLTRTRSQRTPG